MVTLEANRLASTQPQHSACQPGPRTNLSSVMASVPMAMPNAIRRPATDRQCKVTFATKREISRLYYAGWRAEHSLTLSTTLLRDPDQS